MHTKPLLAMTITGVGTALTFADGLLLWLRISGAAATLAIGLYTLYKMRKNR